MQHLTEHYGITEPVVDVWKPSGLGFPSTFQSFHEFPTRSGWRIDPDDYSLYPISLEARHSKLRQFLQEWLFFGLVFTIVQKDGKAICTYEDLVEPGGKNLSTVCLRDKLQVWNDWEKGHPDGQRLRMIRLEGVLRLARRVVRRNLAWFGPTYYDRPCTYDTRVHEARYVDDQLILSLMTLGELLHDAKFRIVQVNNMDMHGWSHEDDSGWGPPRWVMRKMEENWCPRTIHLLRGQLRSSATLLLAAWATRTLPASELDSTDPLLPTRHKELGCTSSVCKVSPKDKDGIYHQRHLTSFCDRVHGSSADICGQSKPIIQEVKAALKEGNRPLLQFQEGPGSKLGLTELKVVRWKSKTPIQYAAISHVWSDGLGNSQGNSMLDCQLRFIRHQLSRLQETTGVATLLPFWMDTLVIPKGEDEESKELRRRSIQQIQDVFTDATYTIVLDFGLANMDHVAAKPAETAMKIIASSWTRRLWTLQEAFFSKSLHMAFRETAETLVHLDALCNELEGKEEGLTSILITQVKKQLRNHIIDEERAQLSVSPAGNIQKNPRAAAVFVVNAWKAVRWRVSPILFPKRLHGGWVTNNSV